MEIKLRNYQKECIDKFLWSRQFDGADLASLPTGSGKSIIIAELASRFNENILIIQPSVEILTQNYEKLKKYVSDENIGIYSASMNKKIIKKFTLSTIGSIYKRSSDFSHFDLIICDEAHLLNPKRLNGMFLSFINGINKIKSSPIKVIGLTATPFRLCQSYLRYPNGFIDTITTIKMINRVRPSFWDRLLLNINVGDLIDQGYLCPLKYHNIALIEQENIKINKSRSDFDLQAFEEQVSEKENEIINVLNACKENFKSTLIFCATVSQSEEFANKIEGSEIISAKTKAKDRKRIIEGFKNGDIKIVLNVGVLTTGFDSPILDCIVLIRPTRSIGLLSQMVGRGLRLSPGKTHCTIVDMTDTINKIGRIETFKIEKVDGKWNLTTETNRTGWNAVELYRFNIQK